MNSQIIQGQTPTDSRAFYIKPSLQHHPQYNKTITIGCCSIGNYIGQPIDLISNPGLELIPDPVDIGI